MNTSLGAFLGLGLAALLLVYAVHAWLWHRAFKRVGIDEGHPACPKCLYLVRGWRDTVCPECGTDVRQAGMRVRSPRLRWLGLFIVIVAVPLAVHPLLNASLSAMARSTYETGKNDIAIANDDVRLVLASVETRLWTHRFPPIESCITSIQIGIQPLRANDGEAASPEPLLETIEHDWSDGTISIDEISHSIERVFAPNQESPKLIDIFANTTVRIRREVLAQMIQLEANSQRARKPGSWMTTNRLSSPMFLVNGRVSLQSYVRGWAGITSVSISVFLSGMVAIWTIRRFRTRLSVIPFSNEHWTRLHTRHSAGSDVMATAQLMKALSNPASYGHDPAHVDVKQTHISMIFLAGDRAYKVKKPVNLGFLDFTRLEDRKHFCDEEVRLNRRLAREVYIGVAAIVRKVGAEGVHVVEPHPSEAAPPSCGMVIDYAVVMMRLPEKGMLNNRLAQGDISPRVFDDLAEQLVEFHRRCSSGPGVDEFAEPSELKRQVHENVTSHPVSESSVILSFIEFRLKAFLDAQVGLLRRRIVEGRIREGHGDLHAGNICVAEDGRLVIYDCIEFSKAFRCRDVACEIAFLAMDLDFVGHHERSEQFVNRYVEQSGDPEVIKLMDFYKAHLALVRSKVEALKAQEKEVNESDRSEARARSSAYMSLAAAYLLPPSLILTCGLPGTGKSYFGRGLARILSAEHFRTDTIRKNLVGLDPTTRGPSEIYSEPLTRLTYADLLSKSRAAIMNGQHTVADGTFATRALRKSFINLALEIGAPVIILNTVAPDSIVRQRLNERLIDAAEVSDADWSVYLSLKNRFESLSAEEDARSVVVDDSDCVETAVKKSIEKLIQLSSVKRH